MTVSREEFVLDFYERLLIRKALAMVACSSGVRKEDAEILQRLEQQLADAEQVVLHGLDLSHYFCRS